MNSIGLRRAPAIIAATLAAIPDKRFWVKPALAATICTGPDDNVLVACAEAAQGAYLVTGNLRHFPPSWKYNKVITARMMLDIIRTWTHAKPA